MADEYISREAFIEAKRKLYCVDCKRRRGFNKRNKYVEIYQIGEGPCKACGINDVLDDIESFPAADVRPVVHGHFTQYNSPFTANCSECGKSMNVYWNYCPNCGARMDMVTDCNQVKDGDGE